MTTLRTGPLGQRVCWALSAAFIATLAACGGGGDGGVREQPLALNGTPPPLVVPTTVAGNFVPSTSGEHQICYDIFGERSTDELKEFKIDPPASFSQGGLDFTLSADGRYLSWTSSGAQVWAVVVKGGPSYNLYDYWSDFGGVSPYPMSDSKLQSPGFLDRKKLLVPQISHYNVCYRPPLPSGDDFTGCTPGYWRNHYDRWVTYTAEQSFDSVFGVTYLGPVTLGGAVNNPQAYGTFAFHAVAALLNSTGGVPNVSNGVTVSYPYLTADVIAKVQAAVNTPDDPGTTDNETEVAINLAKNQLAAANEIGCPLSGTAACSPKNPLACTPS